MFGNVVFFNEIIFAKANTYIPPIVLLQHSLCGLQYQHYLHITPNNLGPHFIGKIEHWVKFESYQNQTPGCGQFACSTALYHWDSFILFLLEQMIFCRMQKCLGNNKQKKINLSHKSNRNIAKSNLLWIYFILLYNCKPY